MFECADATAFQHLLWLDRVFEQLVDAADTPAILVGRSQADGRLLLVLQMIRRKLGPFHVLNAADLEVADYNALVFDRNAARNPAAVQQVLSALREPKLVRVRKVRTALSIFRSAINQRRSARWTTRRMRLSSQRRSKPGSLAS